MTALFNPGEGSGITFLRLQNNYYNYNGSNAATFDPDNTKIVTATTAAFGTAPTLLMSSWPPPANLQSNHSIDGCNGVTNGAVLRIVAGCLQVRGFESLDCLGVSPLVEQRAYGSFQR